MQLALDGKFDKGNVLLFARGSDRDYMMRSEKRPGYRAPEPPKRRNRKRRKMDIPYVCVTFLMLLVLFPVGLIMLWLRKIYWSAATKLVLTLAFAAVFVLVASFALTVPVDNDAITRAQADTRQTLANLGTEMHETWARADVNPERMLQNAQDIAGYSIQLVQKAAVNGLPKLKQNIDHIADNARAIAVNGADVIAVQGKELLYKVNLLPSPEPTPVPSPTPVPTPEPTPEPTPVPTATPAPVSLMALYVPGDALYHQTSDCVELGGRATQSMSVTQAAQEGLMPCSVCFVAEGVPETPQPTEEVAPKIVTPAPDEVINTIHVATVAPSMTFDALNQTADPSPDPSAVTPSPTPMQTPKPTPAPTPIVLPEAKSAALATVYFTSNGKYYHSGPNCGSMRGAKPNTLKDAVDKGLKRCNSCNAPDPALLAEPVVVWCGDDHVFHITDECEKLTSDKPRLVSLEQAMLEEGLTGCTDCGANLYVQVAKLYPTETPVPASPIGN